MLRYFNNLLDAHVSFTHKGATLNTSTLICLHITFELIDIKLRSSFMSGGDA